MSDINKFLKSYDRNQLKIGQKIEKEHKKTIKNLIRDVKQGKLKPLEEYYKDIARDHLDEIKDYYTRLQNMEHKVEEEMTKSAYHFKNTNSTLDSDRQYYAEENSCPHLVKYLNTSIQADLEKIHLKKGTLTIYKKDKGLYSGFFSDIDGQVVEEFENMTIPIIAKNLELKNLYQRPISTEEDQTYLSSPSCIKIRYGDIDIEIKKSMKNFIDRFRRSKTIPENNIQKALRVWRKNSKFAKVFKSDIESARALIQDWDQYGEEFSQVLYAIKQYD